FVGPAVGGQLLMYLGPGACFLVNGLSYVAVLAALAWMDVPDRPHAGKGRGSPRAVFEAFGYLRARPRLALLILLAGALSLFAWPFLSLLPALAEQQLSAPALAPHVAGLASSPQGDGPLLAAVGLVEEAAEQEKAHAQGYSLLLSGTGLGALVAALFVASFGSLARRRLLIGAGVWLTVVTLLGLSLMWGLPWDVACCALLGAGLILFFATSQAVVQLGAADHNRGSVMGIWSMMVSGTLAVGNLLAGHTADSWGVPRTLLLQALACAAAALAGVLGLPVCRGRPGGRG